MQTLIEKFTKEELQQLVDSSDNLNEFCKKLGYSNSYGTNSLVVRARLKELGIDTTWLVGNHKAKLTDEEIFVKDSKAASSTVRKHYQKGNYSPYKCQICGLKAVWNDKPLILNLDHINGDHWDNRLENLRWICPNCDRQLPTFGGRNKKEGAVEKAKQSLKDSLDKEITVLRRDPNSNFCIDCGAPISKGAKRCVSCYKKFNQELYVRPSKEELIQTINELKGNFVEVGKRYSVSDNTIRKWCRKYNLSPYSEDYKRK